MLFHRPNLPIALIEAKCVWKLEVQSQLTQATTLQALACRVCAPSSSRSSARVFGVPVVKSDWRRRCPDPTLADHLGLRAHARSLRGRAARTVEGYEEVLRNYVFPTVGGIELGAKTLVA